MKHKRSKTKALVKALPTPNPAALLSDLRALILAAREQVARVVDSSLTRLYWHVGRRIRQDILREQRAGYGEQIVSTLGRKLEVEFGRGFSEKSLRHTLLNDSGHESQSQALGRAAHAEESFEIVRRRLFQPITDPALFTARDTVAKAFCDLYRNQHQEFPPECREADYERKIKAAYPIHPEIFDRLYQDWSGLVKFQRTRGVLRLMASVIHALWEQGDKNSRRSNSGRRTISRRAATS